MKYIQTHAAKRTNFPRESPWRGRGWSIAEEPDACSASNGRIGGDDTDVSWITVAHRSGEEVETGPKIRTGALRVG